MNENEEFEFRARAERESSKKMGGSPPLSFVMNKVMGMAPWNKASQGMRDIAGYGAEKLGGMGVNPKVSAGMMLPVAMAPDILAAATAMPEKGPPSAALEGMSNKLKDMGSSRWFKAVGGTLPQAKELGSEEALRLGRFAREGKYVTPLNSASSQGKLIGKGLQQSGKRLEELRGLGDLYGESPESSKIVQAIHQDLGPKYSSGIRSGEMGDLKKSIDEVLKLEPVDKLTATEEMSPKIGSHPKESYEQFRRFQEDPNFIPEYDLRRPTTFNEVSKVATDLNQYAKGQSKMLQPSGAMTDSANVISKLNNEKLLAALPAEKGAEYTANLQKYGDLSKLDRMNELKSAFEVGGSRNSLVNNIANRVLHLFGHQLSAQALDTISSLVGNLAKAPKMNPSSIPGALKLIRRASDQ